MGFGSAVKWLAIMIVVGVLAGGVFYVSNMKAALAISEENTRKLKESVTAQQAVIDNQLKEITLIQSINKELALQNANLQKDIDTMNEKFNVSANGTSRDFGDITRAKPALINKIIDRATDNVNRCFEIATGAELNEGEKNNECQELINSITK